MFVCTVIRLFMGATSGPTTPALSSFTAASSDIFNGKITCFMGKNMFLTLCFQYLNPNYMSHVSETFLGPKNFAKLWS